MSSPGRRAYAAVAACAGPTVPMERDCVRGWGPPLPPCSAAVAARAGPSVPMERECVRGCGQQRRPGNAAVAARAGPAVPVGQAAVPQLRTDFSSRSCRALDRAASRRLTQPQCKADALTLVASSMGLSWEHGTHQRGLLVKLGLGTGRRHTTPWALVLTYQHHRCRCASTGLGVALNANLPAPSRWQLRVRVRSRPRMLSPRRAYVTCLVCAPPPLHLVPYHRALGPSLGPALLSGKVCPH